MRRLSAVALAAVLGGSMFASVPAHATEVNTCIVIVGVTVSTSPPDVRVDKIVVKSVGDCI